MGSLLRLLVPLLFQGVEVYRNWKDKRVILDLENKVRSLRILAGILVFLILSMLAWILWRLRNQ